MRKCTSIAGAIGCKWTCVVERLSSGELAGALHSGKEHPGGFNNSTSATQNMKPGVMQLNKYILGVFDDRHVFQIQISFLG